MALDDMTLVRQYAASRSEAAFAALVQRHIHQVHSAAMRQANNAHLAEEITQAVFIILARKAMALGPNTILSAWLYRTTHFAAKDALRAKRRRYVREQEACMQSTMDKSQENIWEQLAPLLDMGMNQLGETDRAVLVLKFFQNKSAREIADELRIKEDAAQKRIARAVEKLRAYFLKRGVSSTPATIAGMISTHSIQAAPAALIKTTTVVALANGAKASTSTLTLTKGALKVMAWTKAKTTIVAAAAGILLMAGTGTVVVNHSQIGDKLRHKDEIVSRMEAVKMSVFSAVIQYAQAHQDEIPPSLSNLKPNMPADAPAGMDDDHWQIVASGKLTPLMQRTDVILIEEKNVPAGQRLSVTLTVISSCRNEQMRRRAFTLIEVLVVIAVIGISAAILLPVLARQNQPPGERRVWII